MAAASITTPFTTIPLTNGARAKDGPVSAPAVMAVAKAPAQKAGVYFKSQQYEYFIKAQCSKLPAGIAIVEARFVRLFFVSGKHDSSPINACM